MKTFKQFLENEENEEDKYLYHATYKSKMKKIQRQGLLTHFPKKNWEDSENVIYLATDPEIAISYAEAAEEDVPENVYDSGIVVYKILKSNLDPSKLFIDKNVQENTGDTLEYHQDIPPQYLQIHSIQET